ncbi:uncharacterized protein TRIREDRAFT_61020 [Trichoderma reesei QM6a]|uniref:Predicted protein n=1 Tax=Hypocrea jecorina (strain QM6a) TaxID=431241 RepID=G0RIE0_HYPJQ|nr:uncharacterized protein TRIREDRAFT_61020 [Trichoderma reesei QM6a]EGR49016.1 predicted protein [Trichoderma reesei QM6a]
MAKRLSPFNFTKLVMRSFMAESGLEPSNLTYCPLIQNRLQTIHGGTLASLVDLGGSLAVASTGRFATGVSTDLNVTYLSPGGKPGDVLKGTSICDKIGKTLAFTTVQFYNGKGQLVARGSHTKYVAGTLGPDGAFVPPPEWADEVD